MHQKYLDTSNHLQNESGYLEQSQDVLGMMFDSTIHCQDDDWYYLDYDSYIELMQGEDNCRAVEDDISEACGELFYSAFVPRKISNCGTPQNAAEVMYADGGDDFDAYNQARQSISGRNTKWYTYDISADYVFDGATTCEIVYLKYKRDSSIFRSFYKKSIQRWLALIAGMLVGAGAGLLAAVLFAKSRKTSSPSKDVLLDDYNASINAILKKLPKRTINLALINKQKDESDLDDNKQRISSPRSKMIKDSLSKVKKVIRSKLMNRGEADKEEALVTNDEVVIIDKTGEDDTILHYG
jgi:gas vesicle protein